MRTVIWNKELTNGRSKGPLSARTVAMQQRFFCTIPARADALPETPALQKRTAFPRHSIYLGGLSPITMTSIGIFDWTSRALLPIVVWCNATM
jgi:hypothetical protein